MSHGLNALVGGAYSEKNAFIYLDMLQYDLASEISRLETELRRLEWSLRLVLESESKLEKQSREKARVSALLNRARSSAGTIKLVLARDHPCPYCGGSLGISPHADHIHPVAKGGLSTLQNMVYICVSCNNKKSHDMLTAFAAKHGKSLEEILVRLRGLGKEF
jgi:5-methylcytosine-specific restriction endonuclease McrA